MPAPTTKNGALRHFFPSRYLLFVTVFIPCTCIVTYTRRLWVLELRRLRQARGWNQTELACHAGLAPSVISQIENGKRNPSARTLDKLATALNVEVGDLFPKAQAPLPLEEDPEQRGAPFVEAWASYVLRRAEEWKEALPEEGEQPFAKPQLALEALSRNELVQTEATMLLETVSGAMV